MAEPRTRTRALDAGPSTSRVPQTQAAPPPGHADEKIVKATEVYEANQAKNTATREENKAKKALTKLMAGPDDREFSFTLGSKTIDALYAPTTTEKLDVAKLVGLAGTEAVLAAVSISKTEAEKVFGSAVMNQCLVSGTGDYKLSVKERK